MLDIAAAVKRQILPVVQMLLEAAVLAAGSFKVYGPSLRGDLRRFRLTPMN